MRSCAAVLVALGCAVAAGCGGGGEGERLSKQEYIAQADAICADANEDLDALATPQTNAEAADVTEDAIAISERQLESLRALRPPEADEATLNEAYDLLDQQLALGRELVDALRANDEAKGRELLDQGAGLNDQADAIAQEYGLQVCGADEDDETAEEPATTAEEPVATDVVETDEGTSLAREEYIAAADAICADANDAIDALPVPQTLDELAVQGEKAVAIAEQQLAKLRALQPPAADQATLNEAYDLIEQQIELIRQVVEAAKAGDTATIDALVAQGEELEAQADAIAQAYGLTECGSS
jgi:hypothetical protein